LRPLVSLLLALPILLFAFPTGPGPGRSGAPGDSGSCSGGSCHFGAPRRGEGAAVYLPFGAFYTPGVPQRILIHATGLSAEPVTARFGFQVSPRMAGRPQSDSGGTLRSLGPDTWVQCANARPPVDGACPNEWQIASAQHTRPSRDPVWELEWTPPAGASGPIAFYVAVNAANGLGDQAGDRIFLNSMQVERAGPLAVRQPFGGGGASPNAWVEIHGTNLPTAGTRVCAGGRDAAVISFTSPTQINALLPAELEIGPQILEVTGRGVEPTRSPIVIQSASPSLYSEMTGARPGETAVIYGTGCGDLREPRAADVRVANLSVPGMAYASPGIPGLCQIHFDVPEVSPNLYTIHVCIDGVCNGQRVQFPVLVGIE